jgi:hypothetical protein
MINTRPFPAFSEKLATAVFVLTALFLSGARMLAAGAGDQRPDIPSAQEIAPLIGGGNVIANVDSSAGSMDVECTYEHARNPDGSRSQNQATLSVTHYEDPAKARSVFDGYVTSSVQSMLDNQAFGFFPFGYIHVPILRLEQGGTYTAFSDGDVARAVHGSTLVTLAVLNLSRPPNRSAEYLQWSDQIRHLAIRASGATSEPNAQIGPPPELPKKFADRMAWNFLDDILWPAARIVPLALGPAILLVVFGSLWLRSRRRSFILSHGIPGTALVESASLTGARVNGNPVLRLDCLVQPQGKSAYRARTRKVFSILDAPFVRPGITLPVRIDPKRTNRFEIAR